MPNFDNFSRFGVHLVRTQKISEHLSLFLISTQRTNRSHLVNTCVHTKQMTHYVEVYI